VAETSISKAKDRDDVVLVWALDRLSREGAAAKRFDEAFTTKYNEAENKTVGRVD